MALADRQGNVNVSKFGPRLAGAGGFINISQNARKVVYVGTFAAVKGQYGLEGGRLKVPGGGLKKFVGQVEHRTFSGALAAARGQPVLYVTERCVFRLSERGMELIEVAPGIDLERDVEAIRQQVVSMLGNLGHKVYAVVNYDNFRIGPSVLDAYTDMVTSLMEGYYQHVTRFTTSTFLRMKLGDALASRGVAPYIYETSEEARRSLSRGS